MSEHYPLVAAILGFIGLVIGAVFTWRGNRAIKELESEASPYEALAERVISLEKSDREKHNQIRALEDALDASTRITRALASFVDDLGEWVAHGPDRGKMPRPPAILHEHINQNLWEEGEEARAEKRAESR